MKLLQTVFCTNDSLLASSWLVLRLFPRTREEILNWKGGFLKINVEFCINVI